MILRANEVWVPMLGELTWVPLETAQPVSTRIDPAPRTLVEYNAKRMHDDLNALTESILEVYLEANPNMAQLVGNA